MYELDRSHADRLLENARQGQREALGQLLKMYRNYMSLLVRMSIPADLRPKVDPSDVVQDACLQVHRGIKQFHGSTETEFLRWIKVILINSLAAQRRRYFRNVGRDVRREQELRSLIDRSASALSNSFLAEGPTPSQCAAAAGAWRDSSECPRSTLAGSPPSHCAA